MSDAPYPESNITIPVDLTNPGQFFACCGLLELADRLWLGAEGWFGRDSFCIATEDRGKALAELLHHIRSCALDSTLAREDRTRLLKLDQKKRDLKKQKPSKALIKPEEAERKRLNSLRIFSGFVLGTPFAMRIDWWLLENSDSDHLKTWAGQQAVAEVAEAIRSCLSTETTDGLFDFETVITRERDNESVAPLSFDSGRVGTAQDIGYSPDKIGQALTAFVWTEFLCLIGLQRFAIVPQADGLFVYHVWTKPLGTIVASVAAKGLISVPIGCKGTFRLLARDTGNRYKAFQRASLTEWRTV